MENAVPRDKKSALGVEKASIAMECEDQSALCNKGHNWDCSVFSLLRLNIYSYVQTVIDSLLLTWRRRVILLGLHNKASQTSVVVSIKQTLQLTKTRWFQWTIEGEHCMRKIDLGSSPFATVVTSWNWKNRKQYLLFEMSPDHESLWSWRWSRGKWWLYLHLSLQLKLSSNPNTSRWLLDILGPY